jgi:hypothetical protein
VAGDELRPRNEADGGAAYTAELYDFQDARKVRLRRARRKVVAQRLSYDRDAACACRRPERSLPAVLDEQTIDLTELLRPSR